MPSDEYIALKIKNETITNSSNEKLLGKSFNNKFDFDKHVTSLYRKASQKLNALARVAQYMNLAQRRLIMNAFIFSQFGCCSLVWMFHSRKLNNHINNIHEHALRIVYRDYKSTFKQLLKQNKSVSIHQRNLQILHTGIFKTKNGLNPVIMEDVFNFKHLAYNFRNAETLIRSNVSSVKYGTETIHSLGAKIWKILRNGYKELTSLSTFKSKIKNWETDKCSCRLLKTYIQRYRISCYVRSMFVKHHFVAVVVCLFVVGVFYYYYYHHYYYLLLLLLFIYFIILIIFNWYKLDCKFFAELRKFFSNFK